MPLLVQGLGHDPDHLPSLDLLSDMLMEVGAYDEAVEFAEKMLDLAPDDADYKRKKWPCSPTKRTIGGASSGRICTRSGRG